MEMMLEYEEEEGEGEEASEKLTLAELALDEWVSLSVYSDTKLCITDATVSDDENEDEDEDDSSSSSSDEDDDEGEGIMGKISNFFGM